ncbi:MAG: undecaprenyl-diphosphate phosphatase [Myxococcales bacterium FL481]|nr:MAG: undecaprenyl-diphosphate phosphatase [Myxococcales bacterium FL481]
MANRLRGGRWPPRGPELVGPGAPSVASVVVSGAVLHGRFVWGSVGPNDRSRVNLVGDLGRATNGTVVSGETVPETAPAVLDVWTAAWLGALQGIAEFLPISSSGHLSLAQAVLGIDPEQGGHRFNVVVHAATLLAVLWVYRADVARLARSLVRADDPEGRRMVGALVVGSSPLGVVLLPGVRDQVTRAEGNLVAIGCAFLVTAALLLACRPRRGSDPRPGFVVPSWRQAVLIGFAQLFAVMPGVSRAGSTIAAGLAVGLNHRTAARFSFLLSLPAVGAAALLEALDMMHEPHATVWAAPYVVGFCVSLLVGLLALRLLLAILNRRGLIPFVPYLVVVALVSLWLA